MKRPAIDPQMPHKTAAVMNRREFIDRFLKAGGLGLLASGGVSLWPLMGENASQAAAENALDALIRKAPEARFWAGANTAGVNCRACHSPSEVPAAHAFTHETAFVKCSLCAQECLLKPGERGKCRARININGRLISLVYGRPVSIHADPIEKKPFYHFLPGSTAFSLATAGCPLRCRFCQNWEISQARPEDFRGGYVPPEAIAAAAAERKSEAIAFTYNEPTVFTEYLLDIARIARRQGVKSTLVSCGFMNPEPLDEMCDVLDGIKIDLKGFNPEFYRKVCGAELAPVLRSIQKIARRGVHLEIVNLVVPTLNDSDAMLTGLVKWIADHVGPDVPVHFTRFHPDYQMRNLPPTPVKILERAYDTARAGGLRYPYVGNVPGHPGNHTYCPGCGKIVLRRSAFFLTENHVRGGKCAFCGTAIAGFWG